VYFVKLTPKDIENFSKVGTYGDGDGLYFQISANGSKSWIYRYQINKHRRWCGLGTFPNVRLAQARKERDRLKLKVKAGIDPLAEREQNILLEQEKRRGKEVQKQTFSKCAEAYIESKRHEWKNKKHGQQWENTLKTYAYPVIGDLPVADIELDHVLQILKPIWLTKTETATRVRNRVELILDYASVLKYRSGENPARWRGNLDKLLAAPTKVKESQGSGHHSALPYEDIHDFIEELKRQEGLAAKALQFTILTATRTSEVLNAEWKEFDLDKGVWVIPKERMKAGKAHRVPLSKPVRAILESIKSDGRYVFPGMKKGKSLSNMAMNNVLKRMERTDITVHGFRSTFRDWVAEKTNFPRRVAETALAHKLKDGAEAAYQRGDLLDKRRGMMDAWASYCFDQKSNVTRIRA